MRGKLASRKLNLEDVKSFLDYDPKTGNFTWIKSPAKNIKPGTRAGGNAKGNGYQYIRFRGEEVTLARLAFFYMTGEWPRRRVKFKNGDFMDHRFDNLTLYDGPLGEFDTSTIDGRRAYSRAYRSFNVEKEKARALRESFKLELHQYRQMLADQNGVCAICKQPENHKRNGKIKALAVDHCHDTGIIRGLLCSDCNTAIGKLKDSPDVIRSALNYLEHHKRKVGNNASKGN